MQTSFKAAHSKLRATRTYTNHWRDPRQFEAIKRISERSDFGFFCGGPDSPDSRSTTYRGTVWITWYDTAGDLLLTVLGSTGRVLRSYNNGRRETL